MLIIDETDKTTIHLTRGDRIEHLAFYLPIKLQDGTIQNYIFKVGDKISFIVKEKKGYDKPEVFRKDFFIEEETEYPEINLQGTETKWGEILNKRATYWYDIVLNDDITILGFDENGAKQIYLYPEGGEFNGN